MTGDATRTLVSLVSFHSPGMSVLDQESDDIQEFRRWFRINGGVLHPEIYFSPDASGLCVRTKSNLPTGCSIISCPFSLAITLETTQAALEHFGAFETDMKLTERQRLCAYLSLHWILPESNEYHFLRHHPYLKILPGVEKLTTPLFFSEDELNLFVGTNIYSAVLQQKESLENEWQDLLRCLKTTSSRIASNLTWDMYKLSATYLLTRAFPSSLLSRTPSLAPSPSSYPVLLPGVDSLNHARGQPVTWGVTFEESAPCAEGTTDEGASIVLTLESPSVLGAELFNNYGPKPNSSLILGYGFALADNPDDTILLRVGASANAGDGGVASTSLSFEVGREARGAHEVWDDVRQKMAFMMDQSELENLNEDGVQASDHDIDIAVVRELSLEVQVAEMLTEMTLDFLARLPEPASEIGSNSNIRREVRIMQSRYVKGQIDILRSLLAWVHKRHEEALRKAEELGVDLSIPDDDDDDFATT